MWQGMNRRKFPRVNYPCKVTLLAQGQKEKVFTRIENIGAGGICVMLKKKQERFTPVELSLTLEDERPAIVCDARIVWSIKKEYEFDTGIEFVGLKDEDSARIERTIEKCLRENPNSLVEE